MIIHCVGCGVEVHNVTLPTVLMPLCIGCSCRTEAREYLAFLRYPQAIVVSSHIVEPMPEPDYVQRNFG